MERKDINDYFCPNRDCSDYCIKGKGNLVWNGSYPVKNGRKPQIRCNSCGKTFSERSGTVFYDLRTDEKTVLIALAILVECGSLRAVARVVQVKLDTIRFWLKRAAEHCEVVSALLIKEMHLRQVQVDELWTFVKKNTKISINWP